MYLLGMIKRVNYMTGKILKIVSNDLYGNVDERKVVVFASFVHTKYMNNYVIFSFLGEYGKNKLGYGSIHLKDDSLVIFSVKEDIKKYIDEFLVEYTSDKIENFELLDISKIEKVELVSYNEMEYDKLQMLEDKSITKVVNTNEVKIKEKQPIFFYILIFILVLFAIGLTILYLYPDMFTIKYKELVCTDNLYDNKLMLNYDIDKDIKFDKKDMVKSIDVVKTYTFLDSNSYYEFKDSNKFQEYFTDGEGYKYIDEGLMLRLFYQENSVIDDYDEMLVYMKREGFNCVEKEYEK